ncbi:beta-galactosidase [Paraliobacillus sp. JSM ZJ581]|uniref:beta-galactosidase n=1 Tax=Paraliobacillus sp. JSM ZJ581 TaxID=3342118 RepID=UPI0035A96A27
MIQVHNEKVAINGEDILLFGAELHYFRIPKNKWGSLIKEAKKAGINMISTYVPWVFHEYEEGKIDLTGETRDERDLHTFLQVVSEEGMYCLVRPGPYVMAEIIDHGVPTWFIKNYPEAVAKTKEGNNHPTRVVSYMHPAYLKKVRNWYQAVCKIIAPFQITSGGSVIMFQLDNEVGMFHWVSNQGDYNQWTVYQFTDYLTQKYTLKKFNRIFNESAVSIREFVQTKLRNPEENAALALRNEYSSFMREHYRTYLEQLKMLAEKEGITVPFVINIHGFHEIDILKRGTMYPIGISQLLEAAKIENTLLAGDYYIGNIEYDNFIDIVLANVFTKAIQSKDQPLFSAEFQSGKSSDKPRLQPYTFDLTTRLCFANGMNAINYYMFVGGQNYEGIGLLGKRHEWQAPLTQTGEKRRHFHVIAQLGKMFRVYDKQLLRAKQEVQTTVGFYPDYYRTEFSDAFTLPVIETFQLERDLNLYNGLAKALRLNNIVFDGLNLLEKERIDVSSVSTLWMFAMDWMDAEVQQKLADYMEDGGNLVLYPVIPTKDLNGHSCTILKDYIDVSIIDHKPGFIRFEEIDSIQVTRMEMYEVSSRAFAWSEGEEEHPVAFEKHLGKGKLIMFGVAMDIDFQYKLEVYRKLAEKINVRSSFTVTKDQLDVSVRTINEKQYFLFVHNFDDYNKSSVLKYKGQTLLEGREVTVPRRSGLMLPFQIDIIEGLRLNWGTAEIYHVDQGYNSLFIKVKLKQREEILSIQSSVWCPVEEDGVLVEKRNNDYQIKILQPLEKEITITFQCIK